MEADDERRMDTVALGTKKAAPFVHGDGLVGQDEDSGPAYRDHTEGFVARIENERRRDHTSLLALQPR
jgi:hypothetical protein